MKIETAVRYAIEVAGRVHGVNGKILTPTASREGVIVSHIWVFGSTIKGSLTPNDLDLLIDMKPFGKRFKPPERPVDKRYEKSYGMVACRDPEDMALIWLTDRMRKVSRHVVGHEVAEIDVKQLIYPVFEARFPQLNRFNQA